MKREQEKLEVFMGTTSKLAWIVLFLLVIGWLGLIALSINNSNDTSCDVTPVQIETLDESDECIDVYYVRGDELIGMQLCVPEEWTNE